MWSRPVPSRPKLTQIMGMKGVVQEYVIYIVIQKDSPLPHAPIYSQEEQVCLSTSVPDDALEDDVTGIL